MATANANAPMRANRSTPTQANAQHAAPMRPTTTANASAQRQRAEQKRKARQCANRRRFANAVTPMRPTHAHAP